MDNTFTREHSGRTGLDSGDMALVLQLQAGDPSAIETLYERHGGLAFGLAMRIVRDERLAEEVVQDAFVSLWRHGSTFDGRRGSLRTWLLSIVRNRAIDTVRRVRPRDVDLEDVPTLAEPRPGPEAVSVEASWVRQAFAVLPPAQRQVIQLSYFGGYTHEQIGQRIGLPLGTVKSRITNGLKRLRAAFADPDFALA